jgi:drug/metabolite transporter (DMT)-like permease
MNQMKLPKSLSVIAPIVLGLLGLGLLAFSALLGSSSFKQFYFSYLFAWLVGAGIALGALFFLILQYLTRSKWSVAFRRILETLASLNLVLLVLSVPIFFGYHHYYDYLQSNSEEISLHRKLWLSPIFLTIRIVAILLFWTVVSEFYLRISKRQDSGAIDKNLSLLYRYSPVVMVLLALTGTCFAFDLVMLLHPIWYSTIFGIYFFMSCAAGAVATLILLIHLLRPFIQPLKIDHIHDLSKLLFVFTVFAGYVAYMQYLIIWYANIPEETGFYIMRHEDAWGFIAALLVFLYLAFPLLGFMPRFLRRNKTWNQFAVVLFLTGFVTHIYWLILPNLHNSFHFHILDLSLLLGIFSLMFAVFFFRLSRGNLVPDQDPAYTISINHET